MGRINIKNSDLGRKNQIVIVCNVITGWTQTVTVKNRSHHISIGKQDGCRSVPRLHHGCIILIEIFLFLCHHSIVCPWLRNHDHDCQWQIHATHHQKLQRIVQHCGVRSFGVDDRKYLLEFPAQLAGCHRLFPGKHLVCITTDGVDLTVMYNKTVWMSSLPAWICVGRETGMYGCNCRLIILILQIGEELTQLLYKEHSFIYDRSARKRSNVAVIVGLLEYTARHIQLAVKIKSLLHIFRSFDERLHDAWHTSSGLVGKLVRMNRYLSPSEEFHSFLLDNYLKHLLCLIGL